MSLKHETASEPQIAARLISHVTGNGSNGGEASNGSNAESRDRRGGFLAGDAPLLASKGVLAWLLAASREVPPVHVLYMCCI